MKIPSKLGIAAALLMGVPATYALADFLMTQGAGTTFFDFTCFSTKHCTASAIINSAGTEIFTAATPAQVSLTNGGAIPLPTGAATSANQATPSAPGTPSASATTVQGNAGMIALKVDGTATTQPISAAALPLPSGASTSALQTTGNTSLATIATNTAAAVPTNQSGIPAALISCNNHVFKTNINTATDTILVQGVTAQTIYICGWRARAAGVVAWFLENTASTNNNCSSANTAITGTANEAANTGEVMNPAFWSGLKNTAGNGLCINTVGTGGVSIDVWYTQF
jgi:hypothetical protein